METPKLYSYNESGNCYKVRLLASLLNVKLDIVEMNYDKGEHRTADFLAVNPRGSLPCLIDGTKTFTDSAAILTYLAGRHGERLSGARPSSYWSSDVTEQAEIVDWLAFAASWIQVSNPLLE